jgi:UDP-N-acetylglucosamine acyltransferase
LRARGSDVASIHPTAIIDRRSEIATDVSVGPFCIIEPDVTMDEGCRLESHVVVKSGTTLGRNNEIAEGAV